MKSITEYINEQRLTAKQIKNITGIDDDDELNAAEECENQEEMESIIWNELKKISNGNPRKNSFDFHDMKEILNKLGFTKYSTDEDRESHEFVNTKSDMRVVIFPDTYYVKQGKMSLRNMHVTHA